jgi:poly(A) polymerase
MKLPDAPWREGSGMRAVLAALDAEMGATRFVGGAVRDTLLGLPVSDVDLATRLQPPEVIERLQRAGIKAVPTGIAHGTITAVPSDGPIEVTTLRRDVATDGRRATVAFTEDWRADAARRDFTINALFADPATGEVQDYFGGEADLAGGCVRFIGDPLTRIAEDHLRILRFFRFTARFGSEPDVPGLSACTARANDLMALSRERIADEWLKILALPDPVSTIALMIVHGILRPVLPEIERTDALGALVARESAAGIAPNPLRRLAALLPPDPALAANVAARLRLSKGAAKRLVSAAGRSDEAVDPQALAYREGADEAANRILLGDGSLDQLAALADWHRPHFPLSGGDLIAMGFKPGPIVARTLQAIEARWVKEGFPADPQKVREIARAIVIPDLIQDQSSSA